MSRIPLHYRNYSKVRARTTLGSYGRAMHRKIETSHGRCVSSHSSNPCNANTAAMYTLAEAMLTEKCHPTTSSIGP